MNMKLYSESVGQPPSHEIILRCVEEDREHPWLAYRKQMYENLYPDRKVVIRAIKRGERPAKEIKV